LAKLASSLFKLGEYLIDFIEAAAIILSKYTSRVHDLRGC